MTTGELHFAQEYSAAVRDYLAGHGEAALQRAYEAGRRALGDGLGVMSLVAIHQDTMRQQFTAAQEGSKKQHIAEQALTCLIEGISPFEMIFRGVRESNERLQASLASLEAVEEQLRLQNKQLVAIQRSLEKQRARYHELFDFAPDAYLVTGTEGAIREANAAAANLLRETKDVLPGQMLLDYIAPADRDRFRDRLFELHSGLYHRIEDWEVHIQPATGAALPAAVTVAAEGCTVPTATLRWIIRNVSERKRLERERAIWLISRAHSKAARRFRFLAEASALLADSLALETNLANLARSAASFLRSWCFLCVLEPDGSCRQIEVASGDSSALKLEQELRDHCMFAPLGRPLPGELQIVEPVTGAWWDQVADGPTHAELLRHIPATSATVIPLQIRGTTAGVITVVRTVSSRRYRPSERMLEQDLAHRCALAIENARLYRETAAQRDLAQKASRGKDEFVAILAHELRNPLMPIVGWVRRFASQPLIMADSLLAEGVHAMERSAGKLTRLVEECIDLARISEGKIQIEHTLLDLNQIIQSSLHALVSQKDIRWQLQLSSNPLPVRGDSMRLEQVILNLLHNAVKYTRDGGAISVRSMSLGREHAIEVGDNGAGIDPLFLEQIFEPFRQGTGTWLTSNSGLGLGLAIARRIVDMHDGHIWAESDGLGCGSTFHIRLPAAKVWNETSQDSGPVNTPIAAERPLHVLLVDDSEDILFLVKSALETYGHRVTAVNNGQLALRWAESQCADILVSDIRMPALDGYELIRRIRAMPAWVHIPAIALTGFGASSDVERAVALGYSACLSKPAEPAQLAALIQKLAEATPARRSGIESALEEGEVRDETSADKP